MEILSRLDYRRQGLQDSESEVSFLVKQTQDRGLNDSGVVTFRIPADEERFTDLNRVYLRLQLKITQENGSNLVVRDQAATADRPAVAKDDPFLEPGGIHSFFSSCDVRLNDQLVSSMTSYPYTASLSRHLGTAEAIRSSVWDSLDGSWAHPCSSANVNTEAQHGSTRFTQYMRSWEGSKSVTLVGRLYSDIFTSCRQYLPPGVSIGVELRRAPDAFSLCAVAGSNYRLHLSSASLYLRRFRLGSSLVPRVMESLTAGTCHMVFNRLEVRHMSIAAGQSVWNWLNALSSDVLPNRIYIGLVSQLALYGHIHRLSTYFDPLNLTSLNLKLNGRDLLVEPIRASIVTNQGGTIGDQSDMIDGYLSVLEVLNLISDQSQPLLLSHTTYTFGHTIYAVELGKSGEKANGNGALDIEVKSFSPQSANQLKRLQITFGQGGCPENAVAILFSERTASVQLQR